MREEWRECTCALKRGSCLVTFPECGDLARVSVHAWKTFQLAQQRGAPRFALHFRVGSGIEKKCHRVCSPEPSRPVQGRPVPERPGSTAHSPQHACFLAMVLAACTLNMPGHKGHESGRDSASTLAPAFKSARNASHWPAAAATVQRRLGAVGRQHIDLLNQAGQAA